MKGCRLFLFAMRADALSAAGLSVLIRDLLLYAAGSGGFTSSGDFRVGRFAAATAATRVFVTQQNRETVRAWRFQCLVDRHIQQ